MDSNESIKVDIQHCSDTSVEEKDSVIEQSNEDIASEKDKEQRLLRKLDWRIVPWVLILYFLSMEDRSNVGFAMTMNSSEGHTLADTSGLTSEQNNIGLGLFYVAYILFEVPSNFLMAYVNPSFWLARIMITWSVITGCMAAISRPWHFYLLRFLLGVFEAGFWPGMTYYFTLWYRPEEISSRIGVSYLAAPASGAVGGLISAAVQLIDTRGHLYGWQWLFLISAIVSLLFGVATLFYLPSTPERAKKFLTEDERKRVQERLAIGESQQERKKGFKEGLNQLGQELKDFKIWVFSILYFAPVMAATSLGYFVPKIVQQIGEFTSIQVSLMSIPPYVFGGLAVYIVTRCSDYYNTRGWFMVGCCLTSFVGFTILSFSDSIGARYFGLMVVAGGTYPTVPLSMAWTSNSWEDPVAVASATGIVSSVANFSSLIVTFALYSGWPADAPRYVGSNMINGGTMVLAALCAFLLRLYLSKMNLIIEREGSAHAPKEFLVVLKDYSDPECLQRRLSIRNKHLAEAEVLKAQGVIKLGGPLLDSHEACFISGKMKGSMAIYSGESVEEIEKVIRNDPYVKNKVWESWEIYPFKCLKQILEKSKLLNNRILERELPSIERGLDQIDTQTKQLSSKTVSSDEGKDVRAHYFLAQGGVDTQVLIKELGTIHLGPSTEHRQPILDTDIEGYLEKKHVQTVMDLIQDGREQIINNTNGMIKKDIDSTWSEINKELSLKITETKKINLSKAKFDQSRIISAGTWIEQE
ncbi:hypothetical protein G6F46_004742 [Rhizopus delemar]|uniref:Major facilitator superfamily (MFS) profile domain-containing protein n=2 Tax=Rhizopus TaxID=4842 RepID=A0A9P6Z4Z5_9FUNG|nr:hypothetical protein G6F55_004060 [Rhizopus delemar]KAG1545159.1 hypothetical protein G6F51_005632 [Rhizopus arrhizus]KAG1498851.1 hypothetical protein G6F54_004794 [Rhizopus delemar]KAG1512626.1 hypothetical protein G6F53_005045 [Rhizopus delemar]KAG1555870.1 hypothetical protein G6F49_006779 [Rhizopus delemar]